MVSVLEPLAHQAMHRGGRILQQQIHLDLFDDPARWPRRPYCTDDLQHGLHHRALLSALTRPYIQANPPHLRVWSIHDVDRVGAALAWEEANLPPPTWAAQNRLNGHAHLVWGLRAPVLVDGLGARDAPMRYLCAVESMMRAKLDADTGFAGLITKNPAHPLWRVLRP
ncbi:MAG: replication initiation protein, partial [Proteobacteria bacterium]|nr:replication initiation protein [Pseudomonadota bacterium]